MVCVVAELISLPAVAYPPTRECSPALLQVGSLLSRYQGWLTSNQSQLYCAVQSRYGAHFPKCHRCRGVGPALLCSHPASAVLSRGYSGPALLSAAARMGQGSSPCGLLSCLPEVARWGKEQVNASVPMLPQSRQVAWSSLPLHSFCLSSSLV